MKMQFLRLHWPALALALLVGLVMVLPALGAKLRSGISFDHPANIRIDDEYWYFARIREVLDGHPTIGNPYLWEHKSKPPSPVFLGEWILAQPIRLVGGGVVAWGVIYDFFLPAIITLLTYSCLYVITRLRWLAVLGAVFLILGWSPSDFGRAVSPQFNVVFWLSQFLLLERLVRAHEAARPLSRLAVLSAVNFGLLFYLYPYYWSFYFVLLAFLGALFWYRRERRMVGALLITLGGGLVIAAPFFLHTLRAMQLPEYAETLRRISMIDSHFPSGIAIVVPGLALLAVVGALTWKGIVPRTRHLAVLVVGVFAIMLSANQHVLTGRNFEFSSHYAPLALFWFTFLGGFLISAVWLRLGAMRFRIGCGIALVVIAMAAWNFRDTGAWFRPLPAEALAASAENLELFAWLNEHAEPDAVVFAPLSVSHLMPIYTAANVFFAVPARLSFLPDAEVLDRFLLNHYGERVSREGVLANERAIFGVQFINAAAHARQGNKLRGLLGLRQKPVDPLPDEAVERALERWRELGRTDFRSALERYRVDYLVSETARPSPAALAIRSFAAGDRVGRFSIFKLR